MIIPGITGVFGAVDEASYISRLPEALRSFGGNTEDSPLKTSGFLAAHAKGSTFTEGDVSCVVVGNLDWLTVEFADIQSKRGEGAALLTAYRQHDKALFDKIGGRFAFALWDHAKRFGLVATDKFAQIPIYWSPLAQDQLVFAPTATAVRLLGGIDTRLDEQGIFNYLYFHMVPGPGTVFRNVNKLSAGHAIAIEEAEIQIFRYWQPDFREQADASMRDASEEMLGLLSSSIDRLRRGTDTGAFLSGGLDSSSVSGLLARQQPKPHTYSIGFDAEGYDEIHFARLASESFDTRFNTYYVTPADVLSALPKIAAAYDEPFGNSSALPAYFCARFAAEDGRGRLLAGDGGDELFAGNERYLKQTVFERYKDIPGWVRQGLLEPLVSRLPSSVPKAEKARSYIDQAKTPLPDRLQTYNFLNRHPMGEILAPSLLDAVDTDYPLRLERGLFGEPRNASLLNRMLYLDWYHTLADNDLRKVNRMCQLAGIEVEYPMLDDRLVEFSTRISSSRKMYRGQLRGFYKQAVSGLLPDEIINKRKQGFGLPFGVWMANDNDLQTLAADYLASLRNRDFVTPAFLDELMRLHRAKHAGYYGEMIWILVILAMWLEVHGL